MGNPSYRHHKIYLASSWRNKLQPDAVRYLESRGFDVYDFRHPAPDNHGFAWTQLDPSFKDWSVEQYLSHLNDRMAVRGFNFDMDALKWCDSCILLLPSGRSAHLEGGWAKGAGKNLVIVIPPEYDDRMWTSEEGAELMYKMADAICTSMEQAAHFLEVFRKVS